MSIMMAVLVSWLFAIGTYLILQRALTRIVLGLGIISHGAILLLITVGGRAGRPPLVGKGDDGAGIAAPLPQAFALTAIVIGFGVTAFLLAMAYQSWVGTSDDEVQDDVEDLLIRMGDDEGHFRDPDPDEDEPWDEWDDGDDSPSTTDDATEATT